MGWFGKLLGGTLGFGIAGPIGAVLGAALGHQLDAAAEIERRRIEDATAGGGPTAGERHQSIFFVTTFSLLAKMAKADGVVSREEIAEVERFIETMVGGQPGARAFAIRVFNHAKDSNHSFEDFAQQFYQDFRSQPAMLAGMLEILYRVAMADGVMHPAEKELLERAAVIFGLEGRQARDIRDAFSGGADKHYAVLGVSPSDSMDAIKSKYRALTREYHPDRVIAQGLPEEFVELANTKLAEINQAYDAIKQARGA